MSHAGCQDIKNESGSGVVIQCLKESLLASLIAKFFNHSLSSAGIEWNQKRITFRINELRQ